MFFDSETQMPRSIIGAVVFADFGQVAEEFQGFRWDRMHADAGLGLRFTNMNATIAADFALLSPEGFKIALGFGESF
jgi:outer membrane translocation and assembly module TamA